MPGRMRTRTTRAAGAAAALCAAVLLAGCGGELSVTDMEGSIRDGLAVEGAVVDTVGCPEVVGTEVGASVVCDVQLRDEDALGEPVDRVRVTVTGVAGREVRYRLEPLAVGVPDDAGSRDQAEHPEVGQQ